VLILWGILYLPGLGGPELKGEEGRRILPAVTMLKTGNWLLPYVGGEPYFNKPPFINWLVAGSFKILGLRSEFAARLPSVVFVLTFLMLLTWLPGRWITQEGRIIAVILFLTNFGIIEKGRLIEIEAVYVCLSGLALVWWLNIWSVKGSRWLLWLGAAVFLTCGMLTKGPAHLLFFYAAVVGILHKSRRLKELLRVEHIVGVVAILGLSLLWFHAAQNQQTGEQMAKQMSGQLISRIWGNFDIGQIIENFFKSLLYFMPWILFLPMMWDKKLNKRLRPENRLIFLGCRRGMVLAFLLISLIPGTHSRYSMPVLPIAALLLGQVMAVNPAFGKGEQIWKTILLVCLGISVLTSIVGTFLTLISIIKILVCIGIAAVCIWIWKRKDMITTISALAKTTAIVICIFTLQYALFSPYYAKGGEKRRPVGQKINDLVLPEETLYVYKPGYQAFLFYVREPIEYVTKREQITPDIRYLLMKESEWQELHEYKTLKYREVKTLFKFEYRHKETFRLLELVQGKNQDNPNGLQGDFQVELYPDSIFS
jgi:4-amino-4-deoxy-L-arabinose transferase-like glycosyltransferase